MNEDNNDFVENNIAFSTEFPFPQDEQDLEAKADEIASVKLSQLLTRLVYYVLPSRNSRLTLSAMAFAAGLDMKLIFGCENTNSAIAKKLGVPVQTFNLEVKKVRSQFNLNHSSTKTKNSEPEAHDNNYKTPRFIPPIN